MTPENYYKILSLGSPRRWDKDSKASSIYKRGTQETLEEEKEVRWGMHGSQ